MNDIIILQAGENSDDLEKIFAEASVNINNDTFVSGRRVSNAESLLDVDTSKSEEDISINLHKIEECLSNLNKIRKERMDTLNDLKEKVKKIIIIKNFHTIYMYLYFIFYLDTSRRYISSINPQ